MHTAGEPVRIITSGYPVPQGATLLERRRDARERLDRYRRLLMAEPRGHAEMYGALLVPPDHPDADDLAFLYGTILTDGGDGAGEPTTNVCVFADGQVDRSPIGSGVGARLALMHRRGLVEVGEMRRFRSLTGGVFEGRGAGGGRRRAPPAGPAQGAGRGG